MPWRSLAALCLAVAALRLAAGQDNFTTHPVELAALNSMFRKWNISSSMSQTPWNITGDPCSGRARDGADIYDNYVFNPAIICDCSFNDTCHITRLKVYNLNISGTIPDELQYLTKLNNLQISKNFLSGPLPAFIGNLTEMLYLSIGFNSLSGPIPKELGNLKKLIALGSAINNFNGSLPEELGNLTNLEQMYIDSIGVSGEIPATFGKLRKLKIMWASDNEFGGKVPGFLGNLTNFQSMKLQGNNFHGPVPSNFVNLAKLDELHLGNLLGASSSLDFIKNMTSLRTLILRDSKISDAISSDISQLRELYYLDLSFNNIAGTLPPFLFNMTSLKNLYLGNNSIHGNLPEWKSTNLRSIDVSYNELSGRLPAWVDDSDLRLNLVANNFEIDASNSIVVPGLRCLQRNIPCNHHLTESSSFAISCGSNVSTIVDGTHYDMDSADVNDTSIYVRDDEKWAISNVGFFLENPVPRYKLQSSSNFTNALNSTLFQSARMSSSSLRYYGLGLKNGIHTVKLQFAETAFSDDLTWQSFGRRVFNIYIQGILVEEDFDIRKEANGKLFTAVKREYPAPVSENFLEVHLFWAGKGTCCIPTQGYYGPSISAISVAPNFEAGIHSQVKKNKASTSKIIGGIVALLSITLVVAYIWIKTKRRLDMDEDEDLSGLTTLPNSFSYLELKSATEDFSPMNKLGEGGFGPVYKGKLSDGMMVAVKKLSKGSLQGKKQFVAEVATMSAIKHRNLVKLHGCCFEGQERLLVYEYLKNKSLDQVLFGKANLQLDWPTRVMICLGTARGLSYLHEESGFRVIHRDIKASNILLDADLSPKISDFGLAKLYDEKMTHISTVVAGTIGYLAPEYAMRGHLTEKADVFAFGIVALEIVCGRPNTDPSLGPQKMFLLEWSWQLHEDGRELDMLDSRLSSFDEEEGTRIIRVAFLCTQARFMLRPTMSQVVDMLTGDMEINGAPCKPSYLSDLAFSSLVGPSSGDASGLTTSQWVLGGSYDTSTSQTHPILSSERSN